MSKNLITCFVLLVLVIASGPSQSTLWDRGSGLIYDDVLGITLLQNANLAATETFGVAGINAGGSMNGFEADDWISAMNTSSYLGYDDWRLPSTDDPYAYAAAVGELGDLYLALGNVPGGSYGAQGSDPVNAAFTDGNGAAVSFDNLITSRYILNEPYPPTPGSANSFSFYYGHQYAYMMTDDYYVWAVRDGDVNPVPVPPAVWLFGSGLIGLLGIARRRIA